MPNHTAFLPIAALMFATGIGIPVLATLNAGLGQHVGSPIAATTVLFAGCLLLILIVLALNGGPPPLARFAVTPPVFYFGAVFLVFYALSITWAAPRIGIGNAVFFVLLGQLVAAAAIDHFALFGALRTTLTAKRVLGIAVMGAGVYLAKKSA